MMGEEGEGEFHCWGGVGTAGEGEARGTDTGIRRHRVAGLCGKSAGFVWRVRGTESRGFRDPRSVRGRKETRSPVNFLVRKFKSCVRCAFPLPVCVVRVRGIASRVP